MSRLAPLMVAACIAAACAPTPAGTDATGKSGASPKPAASAKASAKPGSTASEQPASTAPGPVAPASDVGTMEVTVDGTPIELKGKASRILGNNGSLLTYYRNSFDGPRDPESVEPFNAVFVYFEKTKGLKPFVLPSVENGQERRAAFSRNGIEYTSSMTVSEDKSDTFAYADGRIKGTWVFVAPFGAPTAAKSEIAITVDVEVPAEIR